MLFRLKSHEILKTKEAIFCNSSCSCTSYVTGGMQAMDCHLITPKHNLSTYPCQCTTRPQAARTYIRNEKAITALDIVTISQCITTIDYDTPEVA